MSAWDVWMKDDSLRTTYLKYRYEQYLKTQLGDLQHSTPTSVPSEYPTVIHLREQGIVKKCLYIDDSTYLAQILQ